MADIFPKRMTADIDGDFVVFLIGMRLNRPWKLHKWLPVMRSMPRMIRELAMDPESGFLGYERWFGLGRPGEHLPATGKRESARGRMGLTDGSDAPVDVAGNYRDGA